MGNEAATVIAAQDVARRIEEALYPSNEADSEDNEEVLDGAAKLPEGDDSDLNEEDGSDDLEEGASEEDLTLAAYLGIDEDRIIIDDEGNALFSAIIDGERKDVPLKDLAASYQLQGHVNNKSMALETERKEFETVRSTVVRELQQRAQGVTQLANLAEQEVVGEYNSIDWNQLRSQDPGQYAALRQEYAERAQKIMQVKKLASEELTRADDEARQAFEKRAQEYGQDQYQKMLADNPGWSDEAVRKTELGALKSFISEYGFSDEEALGVTDHRLIRLIKDAKAFRNGKKAAETKRVGKTLPKFQKSGASRQNAASLVKARAAKAVRAKAKKTGNVNDVAAAIRDRM